MRRWVSLYTLVAGVPLVSLIAIALQAVLLSFTLDASDGGIRAFVSTVSEYQTILAPGVWPVTVVIGLVSSAVLILVAALYAFLYFKPHFARSRASVPITMIMAVVVTATAIGVIFQQQAQDTGPIELRTSGPEPEVFQRGSIRDDERYTPESWICQLSALDVDFEGGFNSGTMCRVAQAARWILIPQIIVAVVACGLIWWVPPQKTKKTADEIEM